jgi:hypothetical protein
VILRLSIAWMGSKIDPMHLHSPQESQNGGVRTNLR